MNILVTGINGMLGSALYSILYSSKDYKTAGLDLNKKSPLGLPLKYFIECDITDCTALSRAIKEVRPDIIIHAAAYTDVDGCELNPDKAEIINGLGTQCVSKAAHDVKASLIYISTDFVFDGKKSSSYTEDDMPHPLNAYGRSKLAGESFVQDIMKSRDFFITRTSWLFGIGGKNFVDTILRKAADEKILKVVSDQFGSPTYALDLAGAIIEMFRTIRQSSAPSGIYHISNSDDCSWYRLAQEALRFAGMNRIDLVPILTTELNRPAERPSMSILNNRRFTELVGSPLRPWNEALEEYVALRNRTG